MTASQPPGEMVTPPAASIDTAGVMPAGFGSLRQDDISLRLQLRGLQVRATPLDEAVIRLLAPDSYRILRDVREAQRDRIARLASQYGVRGFTIWYLSFNATERDVPFSPEDVSISNLGREYRPTQILPLTTGFGQNRLAQHATHHALYLFDDQLDITQPLVLTVQGERTADWENVLRVIERERLFVRARSGRTPPPGSSD
jgi:hypothetical protein